VTMKSIGMSHELESNPDGQRLGVRLGERAVIIAAAIAQAVAGLVEADQRNDQHIGLNHGSVSWKRDVVDAG
jgi:hypothetical protein